MFASLKNKIKEETGSDVIQPKLQHNRLKSRFSSTLSVNSYTEDGGGEVQNQQLSDHLATLRSQVNELTTKVTDLSVKLQKLQEEKHRVDKTNEILLETVRVAQTQKDLYVEEQEKIQNLQQVEIDKLKSLLSFREQEAVDRLSAMRQSQQQVENLTTELERLKKFEPIAEDLQDELEQLRHSLQQDKNNLTTSLAAAEEENRHLKMRLEIVEKSRLDTLSTLKSDEKLQVLVQERKLLEQHLEEAHLQLSDIKSTWSGQNLALETQLSRLSKQVAEETTEKRKAVKIKDDLNEKVKQLEFEMEQLKEEIKARENKINLLEEDIDELNAALKESREDNEQQIIFERNKSETLQAEVNELKSRILTADERFSEYATNAESTSKSLREQNAELQKQFNELQVHMDNEKDEKLSTLLKNAELSQNVETLKKDLRLERDEVNELHDKNDKLINKMASKQKEMDLGKTEVNDLKQQLQNNQDKLAENEEMQREICEKNQTIKLLNQRLGDLKKTLQQEFRSNNTKVSVGLNSAENGSITASIMPASNKSVTTMGCSSCGAEAGDGGVVVMDEVNFKYLKHVIVKFLTSREVEARHLIRAVSTLLKLTKQEEQLLHDTITWKMSWFGAKPDHGSGQRAFSIPPS